MINMEAIQLDYRPSDWTSFSKRLLIGPTKIDAAQDQFIRVDSL